MNITLQDTEMGGWPPDTRHYRAADGTNYAVIVHGDIDAATQALVEAVIEELDGPMPEGMSVPIEQYRVVPQPTVIIPCAANGQPIDLTPAWTFPPGTSAADALAAAGYEIAEH